MTLLPTHTLSQAKEQGQHEGMGIILLGGLKVTVRDCLDYLTALSFRIGSEVIILFPDNQRVCAGEAVSL